MPRKSTVGNITRRQLLTRAVGFGGSALLFGASGPSGFISLDDGALSPGGPIHGLDARDAAPVGCADAFAGAALLGTVPFTGEGGPLNVAFGSGLHGRLYTDLSMLEPDDLVTPNERYFIRTRYPDLLNPSAPWKIAVNGLVKTPINLTVEMLGAKVKASLGPYVMECSGNGAFAAFGMLSAARWSGVPIADVLAMIDVLPGATRVLVSGFDSYSQPQPGTSTPGASWIFTLAELEKAGAFLATEMNGVPLGLDHGFPIRLMVPNWYGCTCIKWVDAIALVDDDAPATSQMQEFASRTHQEGARAFARDYRPATMDQAAMPVRVEKWRIADEIVYRVVGIMWGGYRVSDKLSIRFASGEPYAPVDVCPRQSTNQTWTMWSHAWRPGKVGSYAIALAIHDPSIPTRRLDAGFYERTIDITDV
jgi:DMSO/TMAO reductase YedYZ molybdopterin-dependent catalytic subunit